MNNENGNRVELNSGWHYAAPAIVLHWLLAFLIAGLVGLGWYMMSIEKQPNSGWYFDLHKSFGLLVFMLVLLRVPGRINHKPAELPARLPTWQAKLAHLTHWLLYASMILMPVTGFIGASLSKSGVAFFGIAFPAWVSPNKDLAEQFFFLHSTIAWAGITGCSSRFGRPETLADRPRRYFPAHVVLTTYSRRRENIEVSLLKLSELMQTVPSSRDHVFRGIQCDCCW